MFIADSSWLIAWSIAQRAESIEQGAEGKEHRAKCFHKRGDIVSCP
jgi:hypothetical protein